MFRKLAIFSVIVGRVGGRVQHQCEWDASPFNPCQFQEDLNVVHRFDRKLKFYLWYASYRTQRSIDQSEDDFVEHPVCVISVAVLVAVVKQCLQSVFLLVFVVLYNRKSIFLL